MYYIKRNEYRRLQDRAYRAQKKDGFEVCGIATLNNKTINFIFIKNEYDGPGSFRIGSLAINKALKSIKNKHKAFCSFHSHTISEAIPGRRDIEHGFYKNKAIIYDVCGKNVRLWQKVKGKIKELEVKIIQ